MRPLASVIIVNWNTRELLARCLKSLEYSSPNLTKQVIVVDNASADGSADLVAERFPWVQLIRSEENLGFAAANNLALPASNGRYLVFLNPDTEVRGSALETLLQYMELHPEAGACGTTLLNPDGTIQLSCHKYYSFWHTLLHNRVVDRLAGHREMAAVNRSSRPAKVDWVTGACLAVRRSVLDRIGPFDAEFFVYGEEMDLQYRIRRAGWQVVYIPSAGVVHHGGQSAKQAGVAASLHDYRGRWLFVKKHFSAPTAALYLAKATAALSVWLLYWSVRAAYERSTGATSQAQSYRQLLAWHLFDRDRIPAPKRVSTLAGKEVVL